MDSSALQYNFKIVNFPYMSSNIPSGPAYGIYISQLVRIGWICSTYEEFVKRNMLVTSRLIKQGFLYVKLVRSFKKFYIKYVNLMSKYNVGMKRHVSGASVVCMMRCLQFTSL